MYDSDLEVAVRAVSAGVAIAASRWGGPMRRIDKEGYDFATDVDIAVERAILDVIRQARPRDAVVGEESGRSGLDDAERVWLVDPLCGTMNYAAGLPTYAINCALARDDYVLAAVVAEPASGCMYLTDGSASWMRTDGSDTLVELHPDPSSRLVEVNLETHDPDLHGFSSSRYLRSRTFQTLSPRFIGTSLPLTWVASGRYAGYVIPDKRDASVHFTAGIGICRAAGCVLSGLHGEPLYLANEGIVVAADKPTHELLLKGIAEQM